MNAKNIAKSSTARKVVGSLGVLGAAAAVAGMGTFGTFTDSSTPIAATIASGTLDIDVTQPGFTVPVTTSNFVPGDSHHPRRQPDQQGQLGPRLGHPGHARSPPRAS